MKHQCLDLGININDNMLVHSFINTLILFICLHALIWFSTNSQFTSIPMLSGNAMLINLILSIPISMLALYASKIGYECTDSIWAVRFIAFGTSYLVFPLLTWFLLGETMFEIKTVLCILLSVIIILIQVYM